MHFNTYILNDIKPATLSAVFPFLSDTKWHVKPIAADCCHIKPVTTNRHMKSEHTDCILHGASTTDCSHMKSLPTDCSHMDPVHPDCLSHEASAS